jgi:Tfp pilus assembly protein PilF
MDGGDYDFRVRLAFKYLQRGLWSDAAKEFTRLSTLAEDRESRLKVRVELGNTYRRMRDWDEAAAAYRVALDDAEGEALRSHLEHAISGLGRTRPLDAAPS